MNQEFLELANNYCIENKLEDFEKIVPSKIGFQRLV